MSEPTDSNDDTNGAPLTSTSEASIARPDAALTVGDTLSADVATIVATGEPDTLPVTFCRRCQVEVKPIEKGRCPRCQKFLKLNFSARKRPVNVLRRDQLLAELTNDYQP